MSTVKKKLISGVIWESIGHFSSLGIKFVVTIIIARLLSPSDFGVIGLLTVFIAVSMILIDSGFSTALIRKKDADNIDFSSIFYVNVTLGIVLYIILFFASPYIARFYNMPELTSYARLLFIIIPINSLGLIQNVILQKKLLFKKSAVASIIASLLSGAIGIIMAIFGYGVLSLVFQQLSLYLFRTLLYIVQIKWKPLCKISLTSIKALFSFSMNLVLHSLINTIMTNIYTLIIGKFYSPEKVGYYNQAYQFEHISATTITSIIMKVSFPTLAQFKDNVEQLKLGVKKISAMTCFLISPLMVLLIIISDSLFTFLLTDKWIQAAPYFRILCLYGLTLPIIQLSYSLYKLFGKGKLLVLLDGTRHLIMLLTIFFTVKHSVSTMLIGQFVTMFIMSFVNMYYSGKLMNLSLGVQLKTVLPYYIVSGLVGIIIFFIPTFEIPIVDIIIKATLYLVVYLFVSSTLNFPALTEVKNIIIKR